MNVFAKFYEIPSMILQDMKETKRNGHTDGRTTRKRYTLPQTQFVGGIITKWANSGPRDPFAPLFLPDVY